MQPAGHQKIHYVVHSEPVKVQSYGGYDNKGYDKKSYDKKP